jgi:hypothetical protein
MLNNPESGQSAQSAGRMTPEVAKQVAQRVYKMLLQDLRIEQFRRGQSKKMPNQNNRGR